MQKAGARDVCTCSFVWHGARLRQVGLLQQRREEGVGVGEAHGRDDGRVGGQAVAPILGQLLLPAALDDEQHACACTAQSVGSCALIMSAHDRFSLARTHDNTFTLGRLAAPGLDNARHACACIMSRVLD